MSDGTLVRIMPGPSQSDTPVAVSVFWPDLPEPGPPSAASRGRCKHVLAAEMARRGEPADTGEEAETDDAAGVPA